MRTGPPRVDSNWHPLDEKRISPQAPDLSLVVWTACRVRIQYFPFVLFLAKQYLF